MQRWRLLIEYDGGPFQGWQRQAAAPTVQGALEAALAAFAPGSSEVVGAGRTDTGVHAAGQVAHVDIARDWSPGRLREAFNALLRPLPVSVLELRPAPPSFHARFDAIGRRYRYRILQRRAPPALEARRVWHVAWPLDAERMHVAAQALVGRHDFTSYRGSQCQAPSPIKTLRRISVQAEGEVITIELRARSFLHHQVRNIVGTLQRVGTGQEGVGYPALVLAARDRAAAGVTAPAAGLTLTRVAYPAETG